ncbi:hypothetical protein GCM10029978_114210 [Actinoallomurus acanthiterrae]
MPENSRTSDPAVPSTGPDVVVTSRPSSTVRGLPRAGAAVSAAASTPADAAIPILAAFRMFSFVVMTGSLGDGADRPWTVR